MQHRTKSATALDVVKGDDLFNYLFPAFLIMTCHTIWRQITHNQFIWTSWERNTYHVTCKIKIHVHQLVPVLSEMLNGCAKCTVCGKLEILQNLDKAHEDYIKMGTGYEDEYECWSHDRILCLCQHEYYHLASHLMLLLRCRVIQNTHQEANGSSKNHSCRGSHKCHSSHRREEYTEEQQLCWPAKPRGQEQEATETKSAS